MFSLEKYLLKFFAHFLIWLFEFFCYLFCFCYWAVLSSIHILNINSLWDIWTVNIFSHSIDCLLFYWLFSLLYRSFLIWCGPTCLFIFVACAFSTIYKKYTAKTPVNELCLLYFVLRVLEFQVLQLNLIHSELFFVHGLREDSNFILLYVDIHFFPTPFITETIPPTLCILGTLVKY